MDQINIEYVSWIFQLISLDNREKYYSRLLSDLHHTEFYSLLPMDKNRIEDGLSLRYRFGYDAGYSYEEIDSEFYDRSCSILEMMVALALRCEEDIMGGDPEVESQTSRWFWDMIFSLGLSDMTDSNYDPEYVNLTLEKFLKRKYKPTGEGGLFTIDNTAYDLRHVEIWYQMNWYVDNVLAEE